VSPVFEDQQAFYMMELISGTPAGYQTLEAATPTIRSFLTMEKKVERAREDAQALVEEARTAGTLQVLNGRDGLEVLEIGPLARTDFFPGLGYQGEVIGTVFALDVDEISDPVATGSNVFLIQTLEIQPADSVAWEEGLEIQRAQSGFTIQQQRLEQWINAMREAADIVDRREELFNQPRGGAVPTGGLF
jgi:hypothetical protein